ncbi:hypothetical protein RI844_19035 [Thalassotalea fonticola]|uniref:Uncharacterized protein n=1 Tax=Thalassotalea fonticola TaxID=3065649 RepID=A0ABZ0GNV1_9GAMM|nr:hypothetical protein RI844_19035 [Colwelliaceae bacterium S1-1]
MKIKYWLFSLPIVLMICSAWLGVFYWIFDNATLDAPFGVGHLIVLFSATSMQMITEKIDN